MLNQVVFVGRIKNISEIKNSDKKEVVLTISIPRSFKNAEGEYDTDFIRVKLFNAIAENVIDYCNVGDIVGIKGRLACLIDTNGTMEIVADKVTFLSSKSNEEVEND